MFDSLRARITVAFLLVGALLVAISAVAYVELRILGDKVRAGSVVSEFLEVTLEIRRFEKNYFLYRQTEDLFEQRSYLARAGELLARHPEAFRSFGGAARIAELNDGIARYRRLMDEYAEAADRAGRRRELDALIRQDGKQLVDFAEDAERRERAMLEASLDAIQGNLVVSIGMLLALIGVAGTLVALRIVRPLKEIERHLDRIARGHRGPLDLASADREIVSLRQALDHMLDELDQRRERLVRSEKLAALGTLLSGVAHELNNPLSNISSSVQILIEEAGELDAQQARRLHGQIDEQTERARRIVRTLLDFARDRPLRRDPVRLRELVERTIGFLAGAIPSDTRIVVAIDAELGLRGDDQRLQQALLNLVQNAVEAQEGRGEVRIAARRVPGGRDRAPAVEIEVADDGPGIDPAIAARIFDPFFTTKDVGRGSGLGLFVAHEIVVEHGGTIDVRSSPGAGACFRIVLPDPPATGADPTGAGTVAAGPSAPIAPIAPSGTPGR